MYQNLWNAVKLSWECRNAVGNAKLDGPFSCNRSHIILLHMCTINEYNMMYSSWDIRHDKQSFLSFWVIFCPLTFLTIWKIKLLKKWKKRLKILSFYIYIPQMMIIWCMVPEIQSLTGSIFCHFGLFFALLPP